MKKTIIYILALLMLVLTSCKDNKIETQENHKISTEPQVSSENNNFNDIEQILDRRIFKLKNSYPKLYTAAIYDINQTIAYVDNWKFRQILNESTFQNIEWTVSDAENGGKIVAFSGDHYEVTYYAQFYVSGDSDPTALSLYMYSKKDQSAVELSAQQLMKQNANLDYELAIFYADASISCTLTILSDAATAPAYKNFVITSPQSTVPSSSSDTTPTSPAKPTESSKTPKDYLNATTHAHSYGEWQSDSATNHARYCSCGEKQTEAHTYGAGVITKEATESSEGIKKFTCKNCNYFKEEIIPVIVPVLSKEELEQQKLDQAGILPENRYDTYTPEVTLTGYMKDSMTFVLDEKIALKGYWEKDRWDILESLGVALRYNLEKGQRYTLKGVLRFSVLQEIEIVEVLE